MTRFYVFEITTNKRVIQVGTRAGCLVGDVLSHFENRWNEVQEFLRRN